jgi:hypothetical protein
MMSKTLAQLLCLAALSALAIPAFAQTDNKATGQVAQATSPGAASSYNSASPTAISPEEKAARAACDSKTGPDKDKCLKDVDAKFAKAPDKMSAPGSNMSTKPADTTKK